MSKEFSVFEEYVKTNIIASWFKEKNTDILYPLKTFCMDTKFNIYIL